jgi:ABC-type sugar transport system ATPase subunit
MGEYVLEGRGIVKSFPGVKALDGVDFAVRPGEVHALVGENGAGKSTLIKVLGGIYQPDSGEIYVEGKKARFQTARDSIESGIGIVFQELSLVQQLSVAENIFFNRQPVRGLGLVDFKELNRKASEMLAMFGMEGINPETKVRDLSIANQQVVEILKAMSEKPKVIVLDEPTSSLTDVEVGRLFENIRTLKARGIAFIYISHHLSEIFEIADTVTVLRDGQRVADATVKDVDEDFLISNMVGRSIDNIYGCRAPEDPVGDVIFEAKGLTRKGAFEDVSFSVRRGEIVGFSGLVGAGRTEIGRAIFGADRLDAGEMTLMGRKLSIHSPDQAIASGIGYMTEDRKSLGLYLSFSIDQNLAANRLRDFAKGGVMQDEKLAEASKGVVKAYNVATPNIRKKVEELSGGNQQKVLLAAWMSIKPKLLIVDEPTRGVDVGAKCEIYQLLRRMARQGNCGIVMISSDLPEVLGVSDRIVVMKEGRVVGLLDGVSACEKDVMSLAAGSNG